VLEFVLIPKFSLALNSDKTYFITIAFDPTGYDADLQSNLSVGEAYPFYSSNFEADITMTLISDHTLRIDGE